MGSMCICYKKKGFEKQEITLKNNSNTETINFLLKYNLYSFKTVCFANKPCYIIFETPFLY